MEVPIIDVGIMSQPEITFRLHGRFRLDNQDEYSGLYTVKLEGQKINLNGDKYDLLRLTPTTDDSFFELYDVKIGIDFHWERTLNLSFKGNLKFIIENEKIAAINQINTEDYLISVISSEMKATSSMELLKTHAVISRSWLLANLENNQLIKHPIFSQKENEYIKWYERDAHINFHVCADDHCQRYQGITMASTDKALKAVKETAGEVLMYDNQICDARFSKCCGGVSESFENVWDNIQYPYLSAVKDNKENLSENLSEEENARQWIYHAPDVFCNTHDKTVLSQVLNDYDQETNDFFRWEVIYSQTELAELIRKKSGIDFGEIIDLIPMERGNSSRIIKLKIVGTKKTLTVGKELEIRKWLSESHLYSSAFIVEKSDFLNNIPQQFTLKGAGWGHGVGLCQIGAAVMGEKGYPYQEILHHYFKETELKKIY